MIPCLGFGLLASGLSNPSLVGPMATSKPLPGLISSNIHKQGQYG